MTGRDVLSPRLIKDITIAQNVEISFNSRAKAENWGSWEMDVNNRELVAILKQAFEEYSHA